MTRSEVGLHSSELPVAAPILEKFGLKFSSGGAHISRTMMLAELATVLAAVPLGSSSDDYRAAILQAVAAGDILPGEAATLAGIVEARRKALETQELEQRISALECKK